ncbi:MAG: hypothetical protein JRF71_14005 [Deltaproteobacteria bacterium]|nr:hypothetical protein [Deltaproteobacteria bacterium]
MMLLKGDEAPAEVIRLAYGMEMGLGEFYTIMAESTNDSEMAAMLSKLAGFEEKHKLRLLELYRTLISRLSTKRHLKVISTRR